jgi:hypothetical protein
VWIDQWYKFLISLLLSWRERMKEINKTPTLILTPKWRGNVCRKGGKENG